MGRYTYTADLRYQSLYSAETDEWVLQIKHANKRDSGRYECQISTQPVRSFFVQLSVVGEYGEKRIQHSVIKKKRAHYFGAARSKSIFVSELHTTFHCLLFHHSYGMEIMFHLSQSSSTHTVQRANFHIRCRFLRLIRHKPNLPLI